MPVPATITLRAVKGTPLTVTEVDRNFTTLRDFANAQETRTNLAIAPDGTLKAPRVAYGTSATGTDAYVSALTNLTPLTTAELTGTLLILKPDVASAGVSTWNINSLGDKPIKKHGNQDLLDGDIAADRNAILTWDAGADRYDLLNPVYGTQVHFVGIDSSGTDAYAITPTPPPTAYYVGMVVVFMAGTINTGAATLNVNGLGAATLKKNYNADLEDGDIPANSWQTAVYDGTNFQIQGIVAPVRKKFSVVDSVVVPTGDGATTFAHPFGVTPSLVRVVLLCVGGEQGYSINDEIDSSSTTTNGSAQLCFGVSANSSNVTVSYNDNNLFRVNHKATGASTVIISNANWKLKVYAFI